MQAVIADMQHVFMEEAHTAEEAHSVAKDEANITLEEALWRWWLLRQWVLMRVLVADKSHGL